MTFHINTLSLPIQSKDVKMWRLIMWEAERAVDLHLLQNETKWKMYILLLLGETVFCARQF